MEPGLVGLEADGQCVCMICLNRLGMWVSHRALAFPKIIGQRARAAAAAATLSRTARRRLPGPMLQEAPRACYAWKATMLAQAIFLIHRQPDSWLQLPDVF